MPFLTPLIIIGVFALIFRFVSWSGNEQRGSWVPFYAQGKDAGFSFNEIELLRQLAVRCGIPEPSALFLSQNQLDICIRSLARDLWMSGEAENRDAQLFLSKLFDFRQKTEMNRPALNRGIENSRQIGEGQTLRVLVSGMGVFTSRLIKNADQYVTVTHPVNPMVTPDFTWTGLKIAVYFWREDDAGYVFDSEVTEEVFSGEQSFLKISHAGSLFRTQKRRSLRIKLHKPAYLYLMGVDEERGKMEPEPGAKCFLENLSDAGCAISIGGRASAGIHIKAQFALAGMPIVMSGVVRSADYREDSDYSVLHVEADPLPAGVRNKILAAVFRMLPGVKGLKVREALDQGGE
jgi:c-di-GMP-binding flagellar brake protein YcgR